MLDEATIEQMTSEEQMKAMELLWRALSKNDKAIQSPEWHQDVLATRLAKIERGEGEFLTILETKRRLQGLK